MEKCDYYIHECSFTVAEGEDSIEHINRLITSNIKLISNLESVETLVCNANGRITDSLQILRIEEQLLILGNSEVAENTRKLIVSGIHWNEDVRIMNGDMILSKVSVIGSEENLQKVIPKKDIELNGNKWSIWEEKYFKKTIYGETAKIDIILETSKIKRFIEEKIGPHDNRLTKDNWNKFRVENGILSFEEYEQNLLPSELGLDKFVDLKKGCYPGQEIHARLESRGKLKRKIKKFNSEKNIQSGKYNSKNGKKINITTSNGKTGFFIVNNLEEETIKIDDFLLRYEELDTIKIC
jgi:folate-binding protein YgfZ